MGHRGPPGLDSTTVLGQDFLFAMALQTALTGSNMAWTKSKWDNDDYILFCLYSVFLFISMFQWKKKKKKKKKKNPSVFGTLHSCFSKLGFFFVCFVSMVIVMMLFYSSKERHKISIQREKNSNNVN